MPASYIQSISKKHGISIDKLEKAWSKAKDSVDDKENYALITSIFKKIINKRFNLSENITFKEYMEL